MIYFLFTCTLHMYMNVYMHMYMYVIMAPLAVPSGSAGMRFALVEWLLLARSDIILHTYGSSFAMEVGKHGANQAMCSTKPRICHTDTNSQVHSLLFMLVLLLFLSRVVFFRPHTCTAGPWWACGLKTFPSTTTTSACHCVATCSS